MKINWSTVVTASLIVVLLACVFEVGVATVALNKIGKKSEILDVVRFSEVVERQKEHLGKDHKSLQALVKLARMGPDFALRNLQDKQKSFLLYGFIALLGLIGHMNSREGNKKSGE